MLELSSGGGGGGDGGGGGASVGWVYTQADTQPAASRGSGEDSLYLILY